MVSMAATYTHRNSLMTSDRPEKLPEGQDTETLTRALEMGAWSCLPMCYTFLSAPILNTNVYPQWQNKPTVHCYTKKQALTQNTFNPKVWNIKRQVTKDRQRKNTKGNSENWGQTRRTTRNTSGAQKSCDENMTDENRQTNKEWGNKAGLNTS